MHKALNHHQLARFIVILTFAFIHPASSYIHAKEKNIIDPHIKAQEDWKNIERLAEDNDSIGSLNNDIRRKCEEIILALEPLDNLTIKARQVRAFIDIESSEPRMSKMKNLWEDYAYFAWLNTRTNNKGLHSELCDELKNEYYKLYKEDISGPITPGAYISLDLSEDYNPGLIMMIENQGDSWTASLEGGEYFSKIPGLKKSEPTNANELLYSKENDEFSVVWNQYRKRNPNIELAKSISNASSNFGREMGAELASGRYSTSDVVVGTLATAAVRGLFSLFSTLAAEGSAAFFNTEIAWAPSYDGKLNARLTITALNQKTYQIEPKTKKVELNIHFVKLYPHFGSIYWLKDRQRIYTDGERQFAPGAQAFSSYQSSRLNKLHPLNYNEEILGIINDKKPAKDFEDLIKKKHFRRAMAIQTLCGGLLPHLNDEPLAANLPSLSDCSVKYFDNQSLGMGRYDKNTNSLIGWTAFYAHNGNELYCNQVGPTSKGTVVLYDAFGSRCQAETLGNNQIGQGVIQWSNGDRYTGSLRDFKLDGDGRVEFANGVIKEGCFRDTILVHGVKRITFDDMVVEKNYHQGVADTLATAQFNNGDKYYGPINDNGRPHGTGTYIPANGSAMRIEKFDNGAIAKPTKAKRNTKRRSKRS